MPQSTDLHLHSSFSDGSDTPAELLSHLRRSGILTFSITDHDAIDGCVALNELDTSGLEWFSGVEFSCRTPLQKCHILGYDYDPEHPALRAALNEGSALRLSKLDIRLAYLRDVHGICFSRDELDGLYAQNSVGKPHLARLLVRHGFASDIDDAIQRILNGCSSGDARIGAGTAVRAVTAAGGIPVWAHPLGGEGERHLTPEEFYARLNELTALGIRGLECWYSRYTRDEIEFLLTAARTHGLLVSGGSDYHGANKSIRIGELSADASVCDKHTLTLPDALRRRRV